MFTVLVGSVVSSRPVNGSIHVSPLDVPPNGMTRPSADADVRLPGSSVTTPAPSVPSSMASRLIVPSGERIVPP